MTQIALGIITWFKKARDMVIYSIKYINIYSTMDIVKKISNKYIKIYSEIFLLVHKNKDYSNGMVLKIFTLRENSFFFFY